MYIRTVNVKNIKSISDFSMSFPEGKEAGWHVLIGDNGAGKSSIVRGIAAALIGPSQIGYVRPNWSEWLMHDSSSGSIRLGLDLDGKGKEASVLLQLKNVVAKRSLNELPKVVVKDEFSFDVKGSAAGTGSDSNRSINAQNFSWDKLEGCFSVAYGPFRRFTGGSAAWNDVFNSAPKAGAHLSIFGEDVALTEALEWLKELDRIQSKEKSSKETLEWLRGLSSKSHNVNNRPKPANLSEEKLREALDVLLRERVVIEKLLKNANATNPSARNKPTKVDFGSKASSSASQTTSSEASVIFEGLKKFINGSQLLPNNAQFVGVALDGIPEFKDGNGRNISVTQLSDGYRSVLSMTFELIRQLIRVYGVSSVFPSDKDSSTGFDLAGVVLIDEIDAHLHPTWQTRIGQWFTKHFPKLQFIVTTHSPLVCRACENGSIWRLSAPGSKQSSEEVTGLAKDRLVFGDILDAYGTAVFGSDLTRGQEGLQHQGEYRKLKYKQIYNEDMTDKEKQRLAYLSTIFSYVEAE